MILIISQCLVESIDACEIVHIYKYFIPMTKPHVIQHSLLHVLVQGLNNK